MKLVKKAYRDFDELTDGQDNSVQFKKQGSNYLVRYVNSNSYQDKDIMKFLPVTGETRFASRYYYTYDKNLNTTKLNQAQFEKLLSAIDKGKKAYAKSFADFYSDRVADGVIYRNESLGIEIVESAEPVVFQEAEYQGRKVKLGKPMQGDVKKFKVYVKNPKGNVVKVNFGQGGDAKGGTMRIRKNNPKARANFRARHNCDNPGPRHKARYWSCKKW